MLARSFKPKPPHGSHEVLGTTSLTQGTNTITEKVETRLYIDILNNYILKW